MLAVPGTDTVIPAAVTEAVQDVLAARAQYTRIDLPDAQHQLGMWFRDHGDDRRQFVEAVLTGLDDRGWTATRAWVAKQLGNSREVTDLRLLSGGWSSQMRRLTLDDGTALMQRTFVKPFFRHHGPGLLAREASVLALLTGQESIPAPGLVAVDATAEHCDHPTLLMSALPGRVRVNEEDLDRRLDLLADQLVRVHGVVPAERPRTYQAWTSPERVRTPDGPLHRDFHPGNVLSREPGPSCGSPVSWTGSRPRGDLPTWTWRTARPRSRCCTGRRTGWTSASGTRHTAAGTSPTTPTTCTGGCSTPCTTAPTRRSWPGRGVTWGGTI